MGFEVVEVVSLAGSGANEDCVGHVPGRAWVIDGATDVLAKRLTRDVSDARWFAAQVDAFLRCNADGEQGALARLPIKIADHCANALEREGCRAPASRGEHPSATAVIVDVGAGGLSYVGVGDCVLMVESRSGFMFAGPDPAASGDQWLRTKISAYQLANTSASAHDTREHLMPQLRAVREAMNMPHGYGVLSITPPPDGFLRHAHLAVSAGDRFMLATDGLMRLVDVMGCYEPRALFEASFTRGLDAVLTELREIERDDAECRRFPRAKTHDDATGLIGRIV